MNNFALNPESNTLIIKHTEQHGGIIQQNYSF